MDRRMTNKDREASQSQECLRYVERGSFKTKASELDWWKTGWYLREPGHKMVQR